jgi:hypothetical protein
VLQAWLLLQVQVLKRQPSSRLLLCAPQNYSADLLASALSEAGVSRGDMLRLNDPRRPPNQVTFACSSRASARLHLGLRRKSFS